MKSLEKIDTLLKEHFLSTELEVNVPPLETMHHARQKIIALKKSEVVSVDIFTSIAIFLNLKLKLYHAVIAMLIIFSCIYAFNSSSQLKHMKVYSEPSEQNLVAVKNSTVLSCIQTFVSSQ